MFPKALVVSAVTAAAVVALRRLPFVSANGYARRDQGPLFTTSKVVRTLDLDRFGAVLNETNIVWLVDFYLPWCPHCRQFAPEWEKVANAYANVDKIHFGAVDCTKQNKICDQEGVHSFPRVKMYHVPPEAEKAITMPDENNVYARDVTKWIEEALKDNSMPSGIDIDKAYPKKALRNDVKKELFYFVDPVESLYEDRSVDARVKRLKDAGTTALFTLEDGFFMGTTVLEGERYEAAVTWVRALAASFPLKENRNAFEKLVILMKEQERWKQVDWHELITRWKATANAMSYPANLFADKNDLVLCTTVTCGFWTLFHTLTVNDDNSQSILEQWKPSEILAAIRLVVKYFFGCEVCKRHFLKVNPQSVIEKLALVDEDGLSAVALWIWTIHNVVNKILGKPMWPTRLSCPNCYAVGDKPLSLDVAQLNEADIVGYVRSIYKFGDKLKLEQQHGPVATSWVSMQSITTVLVLIAIFAVLLQQYKHRLIGIKALKTRDHIA